MNYELGAICYELWGDCYEFGWCGYERRTLRTGGGRLDTSRPSKQDPDGTIEGTDLTLRQAQGGGIGAPPEAW